MTKVAFNACYGGFNLSDEGMNLLAERKGMTLYPSPLELDGQTFSTITTWWTKPPSEARSYPEDILRVSDFARTDSDLIAVIEEMGNAAAGKHSRLEIRELAPGTQYRIDEYDGWESVTTIDEYEWSVA